MRAKVFKQDLLQNLSQVDRQLFSHFGLGEEVPQPFECVHRAFEHHVRLHPYSIAVEDFEHKITYFELDRQANCLATHLRSKGVHPGSRVCLLVERSILMVVGILGILKAGGAYVPLDGNVVADKTLQHALKDSGSSIALVQRKFTHRIGELPILCLEDTICESPYSTHCAKPKDFASRNNSAYIIYTSGTTGVPKGVDVMHRNVINLVCISPGNLKMGHGVRVSQLMNISFDMAAWEILGSMCNGATLCLRGKTSKEWRAVMKTVDVVVATPSMLAPHNPVDYSAIKVVAVAGEPCPKALADNWAKTVAFYNCCGPTEITIVNTMHLYKSGKPLGIGGPTPNNTVYILDEKMNPVSIGEMGIMWAGGRGITRGYLNLPDKTSEKYLRDPFLDDGSMMFNTGDLGRWLPDGDLEHLGRVDHQVKVKGFRVELDGVAAAMETTPGVKVATAILIKGELWGFFAPKNISIDDVKAATSRVQPHYAVPSKFLNLDSFPETSNGKSDKRALEKLALEYLETPPPTAPKKPAFKQEHIQHLSDTDKELFNKFGLGETVEAPFECIHHAFEHHARLHPDNIAVEDFTHKITYAELDRQSSCLASRLRARGVLPNSRVCLLVERSILMVVGILAVLKAGAAYVPLDGNVVAEKTLRHALKDSGSSLVLLQRKFTHRIGSIPIVCLEDSVCDSPFPSTHCVKPEDLVKRADSAYIIYTSGTTGVPKGVDVTHKNVTNLVCNAPGNLKMAPGIRVSQLMNISFDMAAWEILGSMSNGATLCLRGKTSKEWRAVMKNVDVVVATPSMLAPHEPAENPNIKVVAVAGEPCPRALADKWAQTVSFYNCCGLTEITIVNTMHLHSPGVPLGIGGPNPNNTVYVLNEHMKPVKIGDMGIMWAGGAGITRGYLNLPDKTSEKYQRDPFLDDGSYMFNTGDLGRWLPDGDLEHLGRVDHQVKVKGFRVELDGVAAAMESTPGVKVATAILIASELWGFFSPKSVSEEDVKAATSRVQPHYAVPTHYVAVDKFPETANGKADKWALEALARDSIKAKKAVVPEPVVARPVTDISEKPVFQEKDFNKSVVSVTTIDSATTVKATAPTPGTTLVSLPLEKNIEPSALEGQTSIWAGYEQDILPDKTESRVIRNLRHQIFYLYRRLFGIVFLTNLGLFIWYAVKGANAKEVGTVVVGNLFGAIMMRQDYVIDVFFVTCTSIPPSWPLWIRRIAARVYHIGGLHSGAGASGTLWLILFCVQATREVVAGVGTSGATLALTYVVLALLLMILVFAHPTLRKKFHDSFEATHRFLGWSATGLVWIQIILLTNDYRGTVPLHTALLHSAPLWLIVVATVSLALPWVRLKKVPVRCEKLSNHAVRMYFDYATPGAGSFVRLSDSPLTEWHSFATMPEPEKTGFSLVVSKAGDWTIKMIANPPTHIWKRGIPTYGVMKIAPMFRRLVVVATGSGIGPCTAAIMEKKVPICVLWTAPSVRGTFGDKLVDSILEANPESVIYDTRKHGKPDMVKLTYRFVKEFNAEAVVIISNQTLTEKVVYGMVSRGIPAFGAIWDS